ncbi:MAG: DnaJ domain-containing protein [Clostridia bacterium]|nr:DnaJ domain-containing protein [Clostridia bacterium]
MKDYYEILEVSKNASEEIIEKAYKVLVKKYHPDLQEEQYKKQAEEKMKLINEAYENLSDVDKRKEYDIELENEEKRKIQEQQIENYNKENVYEEQYNENEEEYSEPLTKKQIKEQIKQERKAQREYREEQEKQYARYMRSLGYKVKERWTLKRFVRLLKAIIVIIIFLLIIWIFPPTHKLLVEAYEQNSIIRAMVEIFKNIFIGIGNAIDSVVKEIFNK